MASTSKTTLGLIVGASALLGATWSAAGADFGLSPNDCTTLRVHAMNLKDRLCDVAADGLRLGV